MGSSTEPMVDVISKVTVSSLVVEAGSLKGRLTDLRYCWICSFLTGD